MANTVIVTGRGGTGKSTFAALAARSLGSAPLLIDADPDQSLAQLLGVDLAEKGINTISDALAMLQKPSSSKAKELASMSLPEKIDYLLNVSCLYESPRFDLITLGVHWTRGCYCAPNSILQSVIPELSKNYACTIVDSPAGLEHVNRRIVHNVDDIFVLLDPSTKALRNARLVTEIAGAIGMSYRHLYLVGNYRFTAAAEQRLGDMDGTTYLGRVEPDETVETFDWSGRSLMDLPEDSTAVRSVAALMAMAGYGAD
jgi:CO dehydrogenase maturation factor